MSESAGEDRHGGGGESPESAVKSRRCVVGGSPMQGRVSDSL